MTHMKRRMLSLLASTLMRLLAACVVTHVPLSAAPPGSTAGFDFEIFPSVQYAHTDIFSHTPSARTPELALTQEIAPGQRLDLLVIVRGFGVDADSRAHVTYELTIHNPNGKTQSPPDNVVVADNIKIDPNALLFPARIVSFNVDPGDPSGEYRFEVAAHDHIGGGMVTKSATVRVSATADSLPLPADLDPARFMGDYYQRPQPRLALPVLAALSHTPFAQRKVDLQGPLFGFYEQVLADNPWLLPQFKTRLATSTDEAERRMFALVLAYTQRRDPNFGDELPRSAQTALATARNEPLPLPSREPLSGGQLDLLWGGFFASGRFEPIAQLVAVAATYLPYRGKLEEFRKLSPRPKTAPPEVYKDAILGSALWSLGSNAHQHTLVHDYLVALQQSKDESPETKLVVQAALAWKPREPTALPHP